jgi:trk system potassium uptake protein TrkH
VKTKRRFTPSTTGVILLSFLAVILLGSALLSLPISAADGCRVPFVDALFTATTATCVTGLVTLPVVTTWSAFGQAVLLVLIQIGGLGVITVMSGFMVFLHYKMRLGDRMLIQDSFNLNTMAGLADFIKRVLLGTLTVEGVGALLYMTVFVPDFGARGIWVAVFTAVSAFCNAGIDIIATDSLCSYVHDPVINAVTCLLIVLGVSLFKVKFGSVRDQLYAKPRGIFYGVMIALFVAIIIFGAYGIGFDSSQFIYNQF